MNKKLRKQLEDDLQSAIVQRAKAKTMEDEAAQLKKSANETIQTSMGMLDLDKSTMEGVGTVSIKEGSRSSISKEKLTQALLNHGLDVDETRKIVDSATTKSTYTSVVFRRAKV